MTTKTYTPQQLSDAERMVKAIASVPESKRANFMALIEAMMLGVSIATPARPDSKS